MFPAIDIDKAASGLVQEGDSTAGTRWAAWRISFHKCSCPAPVLAEKGTMRAVGYSFSSARSAVGS